VGGCPGGGGEGLGELVAMGGGWRVGGGPVVGCLAATGVT